MAQTDKAAPDWERISYVCRLKRGALLFGIHLISLSYDYAEPLKWWRKFMEISMPAYAVAVIRETRFNEDVAEYLRRIDETLTHFSGRYIVHGGPYQPLEGNWSGDLVVIEFPSMEQAQAWYNSDAYAAIRTLRTANTEGDVLLVQGVANDHKGVDILG